FGEVQVMDWGLAKLVAAPPVADADGAADPPAPFTTMHDPRAGSDVTGTQAGTVLGTPAYMPPEQAAGIVSQVDQRADVFGLGAILCRMLTGGPPYVGTSFDDTLLKAATGALADAYARLDRCGAEPDLVALAKRCLAVSKDQRPRGAGEVA